MRRAALVGNPNCGKTTLFNRLVGGSERVGNYPGVTVEIKRASARLPDGGSIEICDLPGIYSLVGSTPEQRVSRDFLLSHPPDCVIHLVDAGSIRRGLCLTLELAGLGIPTVLAVGMLDEAERAGVELRLDALSRHLGIPVVGICAPRGDGLSQLMGAVQHLPRPTAVPDPLPPLIGDRYVSVVSQRLRRVDRILADCLTAPPGKPDLTDRLDGLFLGRLTAIPIFAALMGTVFFITFGRFGGWLTHLLERLIFVQLGGWAASVLADAPELVCSLVCDGIVGGVGGVVVFLPQIVLLFLCLGLLEDSGYMARGAVIADRPLRLFGLDGASFLPLLMGFGCTVAAELSTRTIADHSTRRRCCMVAPFISCAARWAVYAVFISAFFSGHRVAAAMAVYGLGILVTLLSSAALAAARPDSRTSFMLELPPYRLPTFENVAKRLLSRTGEFLLRAGTLIFLMSVLVWALGRFDLSLRLTDASNSILASLGRLIAPLFAPLGFGNWQSAVALISGLVAKEGVVSTMSVLYAPLPLADALAASFDRAGAAAFMAFAALYTPCVSAMAAQARELRSLKLTAAALAGQLAVAYSVAALVHLAAGSVP